jgi:hypothetical protein
MKWVRVVLAALLPLVAYWAMVAEPWKQTPQWRPLQVVTDGPKVEPVPSALPKTLTP